MLVMATEAIIPAKAGHLLIVDDDPRVRAMLVRYFADEGFRLSEADDGPAMRAWPNRKLKSVS